VTGLLYGAGGAIPEISGIADAFNCRLQKLPGIQSHEQRGTTDEQKEVNGTEQDSGR
jgi:hypothetical protein